MCAKLAVVARATGIGHHKVATSTQTMESFRAASVDVALGPTPVPDALAADTRAVTTTVIARVIAAVPGLTNRLALPVQTGQSTLAQAAGAT